MRGAEVLAIACDYDRTLTTSDTLIEVPHAVEALRQARATGIKIIIVSGRALEFLAPRVAPLADAIVAENGCLVALPDGRVIVLSGVAGEFERALADVRVPAEVGRVIVSYGIEARPIVQAALARAGQRAHLLPNRDRIMVLPPGVDKATGLLAALALLGIGPEHCISFGDGENDVPMFHATGLGVAVSNGAAELLAIADHVTQLPGGDGVAAWLASHVLSREVPTP